MLTTSVYGGDTNTTQSLLDSAIPITVLTTPIFVVGPIGIKLTSYNSSLLNNSYPACIFPAETDEPVTPPVNVVVIFADNVANVLAEPVVPQFVPAAG